MEINLNELKHLKDMSEIENIEKIEIILPATVNDKIINKYYMIFEIDSLDCLVCFMLTKFKNEYSITVIEDEEGFGNEIDISKNMFYEILGGVQK